MNAPPRIAADQHLWSLISWPTRQALRARNRSPFSYPDGSDGVFFLAGPCSPPIGIALYRTRKGELVAELYAVCGAKNGLNSKLLTERIVKEGELDSVLLGWGAEYKLT